MEALCHLAALQNDLLAPAGHDPILPANLPAASQSLRQRPLRITRGRRGFRAPRSHSSPPAVRQNADQQPPPGPTPQQQLPPPPLVQHERPTQMPWAAEWADDEDAALQDAEEGLREAAAAATAAAAGSSEGQPLRSSQHARAQEDLQTAWEVKRPRLYEVLLGCHAVGEGEVCTSCSAAPAVVKCLDCLVSVITQHQLPADRLIHTSCQQTEPLGF